MLVRVHTEETGTFPMVLDYYSWVMSMRLEGPKRLIFVVQAKENLVYIGVTYQPMQFMITLISVYERQCMLVSTSMEVMMGLSP